MASVCNRLAPLPFPSAATLHFWPQLLVLAIAISAAAQSVSEQQVTFAYQDDKATAVFVAGEFNHWSTSATPMKQDDSGRWTAQVRLRPGKNAYKFYVDGRWLIDPANPLETPDGFGGKNSMKIVTDAYADPVVIEKTETQASASQLLTKGDFAGLEEMAGSLRTNKTRFSDGLWKLPEFYRGLEAGKFVGHDSDWGHWFDKLEAWHRAYPVSITQPVVLAAAWLEYADDVPGREHEEREKRVAHAREILDAAAKQPARCPHWGLVMLDVAEEQDWSREDYLQLLSESASQEPTYYQYYSRASHFYPLVKEEGWPKFIERIAEEFDSAEGLTVYARTAWFRSEIYGNIFKETSVEWPKMKQGFLDIEKAYPLSRWNLNAFCRFAVLAGDRETAAKLFAKLGPHGDPDWQGYARYELAKEWADPATPKWRVEPLRTMRPSTQGKEGVQSIAFSPDRTLLAAGTDDGNVVMWDPTSGEEKWRRKISDDNVMSVAFSADGRWFAAGAGQGPEVRHTSRTGEVHIWNRESGEEIASLRPERGTVWSIAFSSDGQTLAFAGGDANHQAEVTLYDLESKEQKTMSWTKGHDHGLHAVVISPDGKILATDCYQSISVFDLATNKMAFDTRNTLKTFTQALAFSPDGKTLVSAGTTLWDRHDYEPGGLVFWDTSNWKTRPLRAQTEAGGFLCVALSPDGKLIAAGGIDHGVHLWDTEKLGHHVAYIGHDGHVQAVAFSRDGKTLVSGSHDGTVKIWALPSP